jgi:hypothetical protein
MTGSKSSEVRQEISSASTSAPPLATPRLEGGHHKLRSFLFTSHMKQARLL